MKIIRRLPDAPEPTRAVYKKPVVGTYAPGMRVIEIPSVYAPKPAPIPVHRPKPKAKEKKPKEPQQRKPRKNAGFWTPENEEKLIRMYKAGAMYDEMAKTFNRSRGGISSRIEKLVNEGRLEHRLHISSWTKEELETMKQLRDAGLNFGEISDRIGRSAKACSEMYRRTYG
jgi:hypothetical protein